MSAERFATCTPVYDGLAEDERALTEVETFARTVGWEEAVTSAGGTALGEPTITREPNPNYGLVLVGGRGLPMCDDDGEPITDHVKLYVYARGWAER